MNRRGRAGAEGAVTRWLGTWAIDLEGCGLARLDRTLPCCHRIHSPLVYECTQPARVSFGYS